MGNPNHDASGKFSSSNALREHEYEVLKAHRDEIERKVKESGQRVKDFPGANSVSSGSIRGLTPDHVKSNPEYRSAKAEYEGHFKKLQKVNQHLNKNFSKELKADRKFK